MTRTNPERICGSNSLTDGFGEKPRGRPDVRLTGERVTQEKGGRPVRPCGAVAVKLVHRDTSSSCTHGRVVFVAGVREPGQEMQSRGGAADAHIGEVPPQCLDQEVAFCW